MALPHFHLHACHSLGRSAKGFRCRALCLGFSGQGLPEPPKVCEILAFWVMLHDFVL